MGEKTRETLKLQFDKRLRLEFHGARITSDAGLLCTARSWRRLLQGPVVEIDNQVL